MKKALVASIAAIGIGLVAGCESTRTTQAAGEYVSDTAITTAVKGALVADPDVKSRAVNVETFRGTVQLSGFVDSPAMAEKAVSIAKTVNGVKSVHNDMRVKTTN